MPFYKYKFTHDLFLPLILSIWPLVLVPHFLIFYLTEDFLNYKLIA